jgi:hypothetical protein
MLNIKRKNPNWVEPTIKTDYIDLDKALGEFDKMLRNRALQSSAVIYTGLEGAKAFHEAMKKLDHNTNG